jgi:hypothetical protein
VDFDGKETYFVVTVPLSGFLAAGLDLSVVNQILKGELVIDSDDDACDEPKFLLWEQVLRVCDPQSERAVRLDVQARLLRLARVFQILWLI